MAWEKAKQAKTPAGPPTPSPPNATAKKRVRFPEDADLPHYDTGYHSDTAVALPKYRNGRARTRRPRVRRLTADEKADLYVKRTLCCSATHCAPADVLPLQPNPASLFFSGTKSVPTCSGPSKCARAAAAAAAAARTAPPRTAPTPRPSARPRRPRRATRRRSTATLGAATP